MNKAVRKIDLMYRVFGKCDGHKCKDCTNLDKSFYDTTYYKCKVYGCSRSEATDWRLKWGACGMYNKTWNGGEIVRLVGQRRWRCEPDEPIDGQMSIGGM